MSYSAYSVVFWYRLIYFKCSLLLLKSSKLSDMYIILMSVRFLCFANSAKKIEIDNISTISSQSELPLPLHSPYDFSKCTPPAVDSTYPKIIWCICFTDLSNTTIKYPSLLCAVSTSLIVVVILSYFRLSSANVTNLTRSLTHAGWSASNCLNDSAGPSGN